MAVNDPREVDVRSGGSDQFIEPDQMPMAPFAAKLKAHLLSRALRLAGMNRPAVEDEYEASAGSGRGIYFWSLMLFVVLPSVVVALYFAVIASPQYTAESRFAVRTATSAPDTRDGHAAILSLGGLPALSGQDAYVITSYIHSRAIIDDLAKTIDLRAIFRRPGADFWARLHRHASAETFSKYWNSMVSTYIDGPSGIVTLNVRTFRPEDSVILSKAILAASEKLANTLSANIRDARLKRAEFEVTRTEAGVDKALNNLQAFQNQVGYINPASAAKSSGRLLLNLLAQRIQVENILAVGTSTMSSRAPTLIAERSQLASLNHQIAKLKDQLASSSNNKKSLASTLVRYEQLDLKKEFAEKLYAIAQSSVETARAMSQEQSVFVTLFVPPAIPERSDYPQRFNFSLIFAVSITAIWGIFALLSAAIEDHQF